MEMEKSAPIRVIRGQISPDDYSWDSCHSRFGSPCPTTQQPLIQKILLASLERLRENCFTQYPTWKPPLQDEGAKRKSGSHSHWPEE
jgi:hypothetical protein